MKNMNANTFKLMTETLASLTYVILQNNFDLAQLKQNVYRDKLNLAAVLGVLLRRELVSGVMLMNFWQKLKGTLKFRKNYKSVGTT